MYSGIGLLEHWMPWGIMNTIKNWTKDVLRKQDIDTLVDEFDNKRAEGSMLTP